MSTQSWAAWLLDSYASSVPHLPTEGGHTPQPSVDVSASALPLRQAPPFPSSNGPSLSPHVPLRTGRGGAGNFHWDEQTLSNANQQPETEAQQPTTLRQRRKASSKLERLQIDSAMAKRISSAPFIHTGRGGAGNYTQSNEIQSAKSPRSASATYASSSATPPTAGGFGRGGAGNLSAREDAKMKAQRESDERERDEAEKRREVIEQQVEGFLRPPPGAVIATASRRSSMILDDGSLV
jgi:hypothetical protein